MDTRLRDHLLAAHEAVFDGTREAITGLAADAWDRPTGCPGWSVRDQLAHMIGVERLMLGDPAEPVEVPPLEHVVTDFDRAIESAVELRRGWPIDRLVSEFEAVVSRRLAALADLDVSQLTEPLDGPAGLRMKGSQMLRTRVFDLTCHEQDIRRAVGRPGDLVGPHVDIATEQVLRAWAKLLPGRVSAAAATTGSVMIVLGDRSVRLDLRSGALDLTGSDTASTDAVVRLDAGALLALGGGRSDAPGAEDLDVTGDAAVVRALVAAATITP